MRSRAEVAGGHPLHPMLVVVPLGALFVALILDIGAVATGQAAWFSAAFIATAVGTIGIFVAAVPGLVDYRAIVPSEGRVRRTATSHMMLGLGLAALFVVSTVVHGLSLGQPVQGGGAIGATALNVIGVLGLAAQGWLGGELVYRARVGVMPDEERSGTFDATRRGEPGKERRSL